MYHYTCLEICFCKKSAGVSSEILKLFLQKVFLGIYRKFRQKYFCSDFSENSSQDSWRKSFVFFLWNFYKVSRNNDRILFKNSITKSSLDSFINCSTDPFRKSSKNSIHEVFHGFLVNVLLEHLPWLLKKTCGNSLKSPSRRTPMKLKEPQKLLHTFRQKYVREVLQKSIHGFLQKYLKRFLQTFLQHFFFFGKSSTFLPKFQILYEFLLKLLHGFLQKLFVEFSPKISLDFFRNRSTVCSEMLLGVL